MWVPSNAMSVWFDLITSIPDPYTRSKNSQKTTGLISYGILYKIFEHQSLQNCQWIKMNDNNQSFLKLINQSKLLMYEWIEDSNIWFYNDVVKILDTLKAGSRNLRRFT